MNFLYVMLLVFLLSAVFNNMIASGELPGKKLFYSIKGKYGSCNHCHTKGGSAGRWDFEYEEIDSEEGRKIPSLKGIGKKKDPDQIERSIKQMEKMFGFKITKEQRSQLVEYVGTL